MSCAFVEDGIEPVVLDDLSSGHRNFVAEAVAFHEGSILDRDLLDSVFGSHTITGVVHLAGFSTPVSVSQPLHTYSQNVTGMIMLLETMAAHAVDKVVFLQRSRVRHAGHQRGHRGKSDPPESPYGESKLIGEWLLRDQARATASTANPCGTRRCGYFNVVGSGFPDLYDTSPHNLFPLVLEALLAGKTPHINGDSFPTPDGTCVRDYVHVSDLAASHVSAAQALEEGRALEPVYNLGSGTGISVRAIMDAVARVTGIAFTPEPDRLVRVIRLGSSPAAILPLGI